MNKILTSAVAFIATASMAVAGNIAYIAPEATMLENPATMGGSNSWIIPLVVISVIVLAISSDNCNYRRSVDGSDGQLRAPAPCKK